MKKIAVIDYDLGNLFSVKQALKALDVESQITAVKSEIENADALILPGVGAFGKAVDNLKQKELFYFLQEQIKKGKPILGICLGMQLLFESSEEFGNNEGLAVIEGKVKKFPSSYSGTDLKVPQINWNKVHYSEKTAGNEKILKDIPNESFFYFIHSYYAEPKNESDVLFKTKYEGFEYCSAIKKDNVCAFQFHPEKSAQSGIKLLKNWIDYLN